MTSHGSLEQALAEFATIIIPLGQDLGGPTPAAAAVALTTPVRSFLSVFLLNFILFTVARLAVRLTLSAIHSVVTSVSLTTNGFQRWATRRLWRLYRQVTRPKRRAQPHSTMAREHESTSNFESWDDFARRHKIGEEQQKRPDLEQAFSVLGVTPLATPPEIRRAYRRLMKRYHPDYSMQAPPSEREHLKNATIRIRQAYETLTERVCRAP